MKSITVEATIENIICVTEFVEAELEAAGCPMETMMAISIALDEMCSNVARYAYRGKTGPLTVQVSIKDDPTAAQISLMDEGVPYNPLEHTDPDLEMAIDENVIGGLGIMIVRKTMTDLRYAYEDGKNILTIIKNFEG